MISPSFVAELERQREAAHSDLVRALAAGDESEAGSARARLADLDDISVRTSELPLLVL